MYRAFTALQLFALTLHPAAVYAAGVTLSQSLGAVGPADWAIVVVLSMTAGLVTLLKRLKDEARMYEEALAEAEVNEDPLLPDPPNWKWHIGYHMLTAVVSGCVSFFACESFDVEDFREVLIIAVSAYGGAKILDTLSDGAHSFLLTVLKSPATAKE